jgi:hypothetical protein
MATLHHVFCLFRTKATIHGELGSSDPICMQLQQQRINNDHGSKWARERDNHPLLDRDRH